MKKAELKKYFKPIIKECVKEMLLEEGLLSNVITEVLKGTSRETLTETKVATEQPVVQQEQQHKARQQSEAVLKARQELQESMKNSYGGVDLFEGVTPTSAPVTDVSSPAGSPMSGIAPHDPGVDITGLMSLAGGNWAKSAQVK